MRNLFWFRTLKILIEKDFTRTEQWVHQHGVAFPEEYHSKSWKEVCLQSSTTKVHFESNSSYKRRIITLNLLLQSQGMGSFVPAQKLILMYGCKIGLWPHEASLGDNGEEWKIWNQRLILLPLLSCKGILLHFGIFERWNLIKNVALADRNPLL